MEKLKSAWPDGITPRVKSIKVYEVEEDKRLLIADDIVAAEVQNWIVPFLGGKAETLLRFPSVIVDMGAVRFVCNGAKVMRPGITHYDSFNKGQIVVVRDQTHGKALAVGVALEPSELLEATAKGSVVDTLHYISDELWEAYKQI